MTVISKLVALPCLLGAVLFALGTARPVDAAEKKKLTCVEHTTQARFVMGYDHLIHLTNKCEVTSECIVFTDVNPDKQTVRLAPQEKKTLLTYRGSPASEFKATVECTAAR